MYVYDIQHIIYYFVAHNRIYRFRYDPWSLNDEPPKLYSFYTLDSHILSTIFLPSFYHIFTRFYPRSTRLSCFGCSTSCTIATKPRPTRRDPHDFSDGNGSELGCDPHDFGHLHVTTTIFWGYQG